MKFDEGAFAISVYKPESVNAKSFDHTKAARQGAVRHRPHNHVHTFWHERDEIPKGIVCTRSLRKALICFHFYGVNKIGKLNRILNEENRDIITYQIPIAFLSVKFSCKATNIARRVHRTRSTRNSGKPDENIAFCALLLKKVSASELWNGICAFKYAMGRTATGVNDPFWNPFMVKMENLFTENMIFEERWATFASFQTVLIITDTMTKIIGKRLTICGLMQLSPIAKCCLHFHAIFHERLSPIIHTYRERVTWIFVPYVFNYFV